MYNPEQENEVSGTEPVFQQQTSGKEMGREHPRPGIMLLQAESSRFGAVFVWMPKCP